MISKKGRREWQKLRHPSSSEEQQTTVKYTRWPEIAHHACVEAVTMCYNYDCATGFTCGKLTSVNLGGRIDSSFPWHLLPLRESDLCDFWRLAHLSTMRSSSSSFRVASSPFSATLLACSRRKVVDSMPSCSLSRSESSRRDD